MAYYTCFHTLLRSWLSMMYANGPWGQFCVTVKDNDPKISQMDRFCKNLWYADPQSLLHHIIKRNMRLINIAKHPKLVPIYPKI